MVLRFVLVKKWCFVIALCGLSNFNVVFAGDDVACSSDECQSVTANTGDAKDTATFDAPKKASFESFLEEMSGNTDARPVEAFDLEELQRELLKILASHYKSLYEKRNAMLELLSQESQERVKEAEQLYQEIVAKIDIASVVLGLADVVVDLDLQGKFSFLSDEKQKAFSSLLEKLRTSLIDRTFILLFQGFDDYQDAGDPSMVASPEQMINMTMQLGQAANQPKPLALSADELERLVNFFDAIETQLGVEGQIETVSLLHAFLSAMHKKQSNQIAMLVLANIKSDFDKTFEYLKESVTHFEKALAKEYDIPVKEAYEFWLKTLKKFHRSLWVFDSLRSGASFESTKLSHHLFTMVTHGYDIAQGFFDLYKIDNNIGRFSGPVAADWALSASLATWHFFNMKADFTNRLLLQTILGDLKVDTFEARQLLLYNAMILPSVIPVLLDPGFWNKKPYGLAKVFHKLSTAWIYYLVVDSNLFGENGQTQWWTAQRPGDRHLKRALLYAVNEGTHYLSRFIQQRIVYNTNPRTLENARFYSMGIIRPAMIEHVLKSLVPFVFLQDSHLGNPPIPGLQNIVNFNRNDLFSRDFLLGRSIFGYGITPGAAAYQGFEKDEFFIEYVLASYIGQSFGGFWGRKIVQGYKSQLYSLGEQATSALGSVLETVGLMSRSQIQAVKDFKNDLSEEFEYDLVALKFLLRGVFESNSSFRNVIIPLLTNRGYLDEGETNPIEINRVLVYFVVDFLAQWKLLTYYDAARIAHRFDNDVHSTEKVVDNIINAVLSNLAGAAGEYTGSLAGQLFGEWVICKTGPLYSKFKGAPVQAQKPAAQ